MIINDIYDVNIDKINNPERPLVKGTIKIYEASIIAFLLLGLCKYLSLTYLNDNMNLIVDISIIFVNIYTIILKKIIFIKNISCAFIVSLSIFFSGLAVSTSDITNNNNFGLLVITMAIIFYSSWTIELLLDIYDHEGDKKNNIMTIPTIFGNYTGWIITNIISYYNIISNSLSLYYLYNNIYIGSFLLLIFIPIH